MTCQAFAVARPGVATGVLAAILSVLAAVAGADELTPFYHSNQHPLVQIFGLPRAEGGYVTPAGTWRSRFGIDIANNFTTGSDGEEDLLLDGETYRVNLGLRRGLGGRLEVGIDVPYVHHSGGVLDDVIDGTHDLLGLDSGRSRYRRNDILDYRYTIGGTDRVRVTSSGGGIGDVSLSAALARPPTADTGSRYGRR